jgi:hypothetical protein
VAGPKRWGFSGEKMWKTRERMETGWWHHDDFLIFWNGLTESVWYSLMDDSVTVWPFRLCCVLSVYSSTVSQLCQSYLVHGRHIC